MNVDQLPPEVLVVLAALAWAAYGIVRWYEHRAEQQAADAEVGDLAGCRRGSGGDRSGGVGRGDRVDVERAGSRAGLRGVHGDARVRPRLERVGSHAGRGIDRGRRSSGVLLEGVAAGGADS